MAEIYPSLLAADQQHLDKVVRQLEPVCPGFHIDIMDNKFVPNTGISVEKDQFHCQAYLSANMGAFDGRRT